jgi:hypothetical protein
MDALRTELKNLLCGGQAYEPFESVVKQFNPNERGLIPFGAEHSAWQIVEHIRLAQRDILDYTKNEDGTYKEKKWPDAYWPASAVPEPGEWAAAISAIQAGIDEFEALLADPRHDLLVPFPWGGGHTLMREILVAADHVAYHAGQLVELRRWIDSSA